MEFLVPDMSCGHCTSTIEKTIKAADPGASLGFDLAGRRVKLESKLSPSEVAELLAGAGYSSEPVAA